MVKLSSTIFTTAIFLLLTACGGGSGGSTFDSDTNSDGNTNSGSNGSTSGGTYSDNTNNVLLKKTTIRANGATYTYSFNYDNSHRINRLVLDIDDPAEHHTYDYTYDSNNDLIEIALTGEDGTHYEYDNHQLMKIYSKHPNGRIGSITEATEWDDNYLPTLIQSSTYNEDGSQNTSRIKHNTFTNKELTHSEEVLSVNLSGGGVATTTTITDITYDQNHANHLIFLQGSPLLDFRPLNAAPFSHHLLKRTMTTISETNGTQVVEVTYTNTYNSLGNPIKHELVMRHDNIIHHEETIENEYENAN